MTERSASPYVGALIVAAGSGAAASGYLLARQMPPGPVPYLLLGGLATLVVLVHRYGLIVPWRGESTIVSPDEPMVLLSLLLLPAPAVVIMSCASAIVIQLLARREPLKAAFNVASYTLAACGAAATFVLATRLAGAPPILGGVLAIVAYTTVSQLLISGVFAILERANPFRIYWERYALPGALHAAIGTSVGVAAVALWSYSPFALLALVPLVGSAVLFLVANARSQRENQARERLARMVDMLAQETELDRVVGTVLEACGAIFNPGSVQLQLEPRPELPETTTWTWARAFAGGPAPRIPPIEEPIVSSTGKALGSISIFPSHKSQRGYGRVERGILRIVCAQTASAIENTVSLHELIRVRGLSDRIVANAPAGIAHVDREGALVDANPYLRRVLQLREDARSLAESPAVLADPVLVARVRGLLDGAEFHDHELAMGRDEERQWFSVSGVRIDETAGGGGILLFHDVTAHRRSMVTRPLMRRIVLDLVERLAAPQAAISDVGRSLALEVNGTRIEDFVSAFREMGLGELSFDKFDGQTYVFTARDLVERRKRSRQPSCYLALGFTEGAVAKLHGGGSLGTEVRCQSQGHEECQFLVVPRDRITPPKPGRRAKAGIPSARPPN